MEIKVTNLTYKVKDNYIFENLNLNFQNGTYLLKGNNGMGKTTLLNILHGILKDYQGSVKKTEKVMFINQEPLFFEKLSIYDNIKILVPYNKRDKVIKVLNFILDVSIKQKVEKLSGGEKQILNLIIGFCQDYKIYFIDEPFNNLSILKVKIVLKLIDKIREKADILIIVDHYEKIDVDKILEIKDRDINVIF